MAKFSSAFHGLLILLMFTAAEVVVKADVCSEDMGGCDDCTRRCAAKHPGAQGTCDSNSTCKCFFVCGVQAKLCDVAIGIYATGCTNDWCNSECAAKYPGDQGGHGYCYSIPPYESCHCVYVC